MDKPHYTTVVALRKAVQIRANIGITKAQDECAAMLHTSRRAWQQWERNERRMHPAFWELAQIKARTQYDIEL